MFDTNVIFAATFPAHTYEELQSVSELRTTSGLLQGGTRLQFHELHAKRGTVQKQARPNQPAAV